MPPRIDVSIIIINWKSASFVRKCVASIYKNTSDIAYEVVVLDNASYDGCAEMLREQFPEVRYIQNRENVGFARANNIGSRYSWGRVLLFLNPDTEIQGPAIQEMLRFIDRTLGAGIVGAKLLNTDLSIQTSCIQRFPSILNQVCDADVMRKALPTLSLWGTQRLTEQTMSPISAEVISGACQMISRDLFEQIGFFDEKYFMYVEDAELCYRAHLSGRRNFCLPKAIVIHHGGQSSLSAPQSDFAVVMMRESLRIFFDGQRPGRGILYRAAMGLVAALRLMLTMAAMIGSLGMYRRSALFNVLRKWMKVLSWSFGRETWVRPLQGISSEAV